MKATTLALFAAFIVTPLLLHAQEREDRTLLTQAQMTAIINGRGGGAGGRGGAATGFPDEFNAEFSLLMPGKMSVLQVRDFLSGEFTPLPLADVLAALRAHETQGSIKLVPRSGR